MTHEPPFDMSIVIFALLAAFLIWKLRSVLGTRQGNEEPRDNSVPGQWPSLFSPKSQDPSQANKNGAPGQPTFPNRPSPAGASGAPAEAGRNWSAFVEPNSPAAAGLEAIAKADPAFAPGPFLEGARHAYEMIVNAFAEGQRSALANLLVRDVYAGFEAAITERESQGHKVELTFVSLDAAKIEEAALFHQIAEITLRYKAKMIKVTRDAQGAVVEGSPDHVVDVDDLWTFERMIGSQDPNWKLAATKTGTMASEATETRE
ncbi:Tim44/TimA family putative adaptor protein [Beijerinckia indica]|uniref:Import inner membrane translocase subunit Tim44 n=1 Tax=Beijerinckia indica subsp. indica (strain ATCC 9039 / DSM 1715 / NCIMB 8712) TaxID=395963 RepID=B2IC75_BEII9|nr:Tim44/TimA family putative adaptor protein [Beijerinckia indica]ACB96672.1 import inner membrane translocase subunit Tim44 [Beijerinckia indica subsp. indica ATCC 9039]